MASQLSFSASLPNTSSHLAGARRQIAGAAPHPSLQLHPLQRPLAVDLATRSSNPSLAQPIPSLAGFGGDKPPGGSGNGGGGGGGGGGDHDHDHDRVPDEPSAGILEFLLSGWRSRVAADPEFGFKVLMEELVGVTANVLGDMASRPNFGLTELDFVFSTLVVGYIVNFVVMYLLAPTAAASPAAAASFLPSHMFEPGAYSAAARLTTLFYKGATFAVVGFAAGLAGTAISNGLIALRKRLDPEFVTPNKAPPTVLNALTWALHMGVSSNLRYQTLNGVEFVMAKAMPPPAFKASVVVLRCLNNVVGGMSFVALARLTGSQKSGEGAVELKEGLVGDGVKESLVGGDGDLQENEPESK